MFPGNFFAPRVFAPRFWAKVGGASLAAPQGVDFTALTDYLMTGGDLTGNADSKQMTGSFWFKSIGTIDTIYDSISTGGARVILDNSGAIRIQANNAAGTEIVSIRSSAGLNDGTWHHCCFSFDLTSTALRHIYVDDVSDLATIDTYINDTIDFTRPEHAIGRLAGVPSSGFGGCMADLWVDFGYYIALGVTANRREFIGPAAAESVDLGNNGENPSGTSPILYFARATADWHTNKGTGGGFTEFGALTDCADNPPAYGTQPSSSPIPVFMHSYRQRRN